MRRFRRSIGKKRFLRHRHRVRIGSMRGLTSIPVRFRGRRR